MTVTQKHDAGTANEPEAKRAKTDDAAPAVNSSPVKAGDSFPTGVTVRIMGDDGPEPKQASELLKGKKAVLFGVPGAFTPTCSSEHLPGFKNKIKELQDKGVDLVACTSVNDAFVMRAWAKDQGVSDEVLMLADGNGDLAAALGLLADKSSDGLGSRSQRFALICDDLNIKYVGVDEKGNMDKSGPDAVLQQL